MSEIKDERIKEAIKNAAATFIQGEVDNTSLITVTNIVMKNKGKDAHILVSVLPESKTEVALGFLNRKRYAMRNYLKTHSRMRILPFFYFELDQGEKNRQKIDTIIYNEENKAGNQ